MKTKLLILGGNAETVPLVKVAKEIGYLVGVTDNNPHSLSKKYSHFAHLVDGMDVDGLVRLVNEENYDGVLIGVVDVLIPSYFKVCSILGLPCYVNEKSMLAFSRKDVFKETLRSNYLQGVPEISLEYFVSLSNENRIPIGPFMVKAVDNGGGIGISKVDYTSDIIPVLNSCLKHSKANKVIIERYMNCSDVGIYLTIQDSIVSLSAIYDRYTKNPELNGSRLCVGGLYPSKYADLFLSADFPKIESMLNSLEIENGILMLTAFLENNKFYYYDVGFRLQGEAPNILLKSIYGYDQLRMLIEFAMTGRFGQLLISDYDKVDLNGNHACTLWVNCKNGLICRIQGLEEIRLIEDVVSVVTRLDIGSKVLTEHIDTEKQVFCRIYIVSKSDSQRKNVIRKIQSTLKIFNENDIEIQEILLPDLI